MKRLRYKYKLLLSFTAIFAAFAAIMVLFEMHYERTLRLGDFRSQMSTYVDMAHREIAAEGGRLRPATFTRFQAAMPRDVRFTILTRGGKVVYESGSEQAARMDNHLHRPEVNDALRIPEGSYDVRLSSTYHRDYFYYARVAGPYIIRVARPYEGDVRGLLRPTNVFLLFVLLVLPIALVVLIYVSDGFGRAVVRLREFADQAAHGQINYSAIDFPHSELGDIGRRIMSLYRQIEEKGQEARTDRERLIRHFRYFEGGIAIFDKNKEKVYANPRFVQYVNSILPTPTGNIDTIWQAEAFQAAREFAELNAGTQASDDEVPVMRYNIHSGGANYAVQVVVYSETGFEMTIYDVTRAEKNRILKQQMSNNITHELRTPVSSIRGYIETILECDGLSDERKRYFLERAYNQVIRLSELIRDVAIINKVEEAPETLHKENVSPHDIMAEVVEEFQQKIADNSITVENNIAPDITVYGNYSLVYSIFRNLVENAVRYAGRGVRICAECYNSDDDFCFFNFYDTGKGCPEEHLPRLFERFYRAEEGRTRDTGGSGLGLSIVRNAVAFHKGNISVRNRVGGGLQFLFSLQRRALE